MLFFGAASPSISLALGSNTVNETDAYEEATVTESEVLDGANELTYTEIAERRDAFTKHFKRSDGKYVAIVYSEAVHTLQDGAYVNLDNRLLQTEDARYETVSDSFQVSFAPTASAQDSVSLSFEGYTLSWRVSVVKTLDLNDTWQPIGTSLRNLVTSEAVSLTPASGVTGSVRDVALSDANEREVFTKDEISSTFMSTSGFTYQNAFSSLGNVDLRYTVSNNRLEEDIIINQKGEIASYVLEMTAEGLVAVLTEDNEVVFYEKDGKDVFTIGMPWMYDAADAYSLDVTVSLVQKGDQVTIVYTPDAEWINANERVYPIVIDPSVKSRNYTSNYQDTFVTSGSSASTATPKLTVLRVGKQSNNINETYLKLINYPMTLTNSVNITGATFHIFGNNSSNMKMKVVTTSWDENTISYDTRPLGTGSAYSPSSTTQLSSVLNDYCFNLTPAIDDYEYYYGNRSGFFQSYFKGVRLYSDPVISGFYTLRSSNLSDPTLRPYFEIEYEYFYIDPVVDNGIYSIKNLASGKSLTTSSSSTNVYQYTHSASQGQSFRLDGYGAFRLESILRSGEVLTYAFSDGETQGTTNLYTASPSTALADGQDFIFEYVEDTAAGYPCYAIVSRADTSMALTANGTANGSSTGSAAATTGNVVMAAYTGDDSQLWYLESGSKPLFNGNDIVSQNGNTLFYDYGVDAIFIQPYCYVTTYGETITWSSSDTDAVSLATNGKITDIGIGETTITATITGAGASRSYSYTVKIGLANGVYRIKNVGTGKYLGIPEGTYSNGTDAVMSSLCTSGIEQYGQLWKVYHIGDGRYSIRFMPQLNMALDVTSSIVDIWGIGMTDTRSGVPNYAEWDVRLDESNNYVLRHNGSESTVLTAGTTVTVSAYNELSSQKWQLEEYDLDEGVVLFTHPSWLAPKESGTVTGIVYSEALVAQGLTLSSNNSNIAKIENNQVVGVSEGTAKITVTSTANSSLSTWFWVSVSILENGDYLFRNPTAKKVVTSDNDLFMDEFENSENQLYELIRINEDFYQIRSKTSGLYLTVPNNSTDDEIEILESTWNGSSGQQWKFEITDNNLYKVYTKAASVMDAPVVLCCSNSDVKQDEWIDNDSYYDEWHIGIIHTSTTVALEGQEKSNWCWAAASLMFAKHYDSTITIDQEDIVMAIKGNTDDDGATISEIRNAIAFCGLPSNSYVSVGTIVNDVSINGVYSENIIRQYIDDGHILLISRAWTPLNGHSVILYGYIYFGNKCYYLFKDPWDYNKGYFESNKGSHTILSYEKLYNGFATPDDDLSDDETNLGIWVSTIVAVTDYCTNTIDGAPLSAFPIPDV